MKRRGRAVLLAFGATGLLGVGFLAGLLVGNGAGDNSTQAGITSASKAPDNGPTPDPIITPTNQYTPTETVPAYATPTAKDFKLAVKVLKKECFGSAGCNLTYRILVTYGGADLDPTLTYEVVYEVRGGEDGPVTNTLTVTGDTSSVDEEEFVSTKSRSTKLNAIATEVTSR
ncbi:hypothetical protein [Kribbella jiaozuonensis]|uniref:Uncharacterized protein n=1 Tax=Kribbella jiaozuonensis TaxID=2575441 RepID=A0A4U3M5F1_9ACTN|nr:hypothetical protein [Kribbella jiaozuonensis]TKK82587.1 hypothetical protein FDA38_07355 [Kribbella jiaozuonensis]